MDNQLPIREIYTEPPEVVQQRRKQIRKLFDKGHYVGFRQGALLKVANQWRENDMHDLIGVYTSGRSLAIAWEQSGYEIIDLGPSWTPPN